MIPVTKPYLPSREKFDKYVDGIYEREWLTNNGPLVQELTKRLEEYLGVENLLLVSNGTLALQIAYRALNIQETVSGKPAEAITTPFTFVATSSSLKWEGIEPVFADIDPDTWCLDPNKIEPAITEQTKAIVPVHVFGNACDVEAIEEIGNKHNLKVIYDAAHAFGVNYKGESLLKQGDAATLSFHATKLFHSIEGGAIIFKRKEDLEIAKKMISFGITGPDTIEELGINAKMNEFQAGMGLCILDDIELVKHGRLKVTEHYNRYLSGKVVQQKTQTNTTFNYSYYPIVLESQEQVIRLMKVLKSEEITARRYFYPSLDLIEAFSKGKQFCYESKYLSERILCLPLYCGLDEETVEKISNEVIKVTLNPEFR